MTPHLVVRVDGDTYAVEHRGNLAASLGHALDIALPDPGSTVHAAIVEAPDAGAARLIGPDYWIGTDDDHCDAVDQIVHCLGLDPESVDVEAIVGLAVALGEALAPYRADRRCDDGTGVCACDEDPDDPQGPYRGDS